ncbi:hypothetical protein [Levilactobacillus suantsaiihabitans]|uniref:Uncharacterized protein n=1 Tax=Levilactobacillus suantsaiihabitans TaxID=2487722 RepID=A0A4Z0J9G2_9LACO|nr:hypothetical protein [Levilactobacillus suantsaiihabitans]TGD17646.1 hypothetical protein EGT51_11395 [Levilactobacillus suantsaiihabitans]
MKKCMIVGAIVLAAVSLGACGRQRRSSRAVAFERTGQAAQPRVWYFARSRTRPNAQTPLRAIVVTQHGRTLTFRVPRSVTLGAAAKLSSRQVKIRGAAWAKQDFTQQRRALIKTTRAELAAERQNLRRNQNATVVSFATIKTDRRVIANAQRRLRQLQRTRFKQPRPQPIVVTVKGRQETLHVATMGFVQAASDSDNQAAAYRRTTTQIAPVPYTQTSDQPVRIGAAIFGYYQGAHAGSREYALTQVGRRGAVKFDLQANK